jgi:peptidoglycan hydrolase-like protein with peptidoglycan-binding domain
LTLAFVLGAVASAAGIYFFQGMNPWRPPPPSAIAGMPPLPPQSAPAAALPPSSPVVAPRAPANLSPKEAEAAASIAPKAATPMPDQASLSPSEIAEIQARLESLGMNPGPWDGVWGPQTATAIRRYEKSKGQPQIRNVSRELLERLRREAPAIQAPPVEATPVVPSPPVPAMERPDQYELNTSEIWEVQERLEFLGMQPGSPDGTPGYRTFNAIRRYEESRGQAETGKLDRELLERLRWDLN